MSEDNNSITELEKHKQSLENFYANVKESQILNAFLMRIKNFHIGAGRTFYPYIQPVVALSYALFLLFIICIMYKRKMIGIFQGMFLLSNLFEVIAPLIETLLWLIFYFIADPSVPMPFPWCAIYFYNIRTMKTLLHMIASYLNIILGINRLCAVYVPFKMNRLFTRKKAVLYCSIPIVGCTILSACVNLNLSSLTTKTWVDDVWRNNEVQFYTACALDNASYSAEKGVEMQIIELVFYTFPPFILVAMSILLVKKMRHLNSQHENLHETSDQNQRASRRLNNMNRVAVWVFMSFLTTELPLFVVKLYGGYNNLQFFIYGIEATKKKNVYLDEALEIVFECLLPIDLIVYFILSKKLQREIKQSIKTIILCKHGD